MIDIIFGMLLGTVELRVPWNKFSEKKRHCTVETISWGKLQIEQLQKYQYAQVLIFYLYNAAW